MPTKEQLQSANDELKSDLQLQQQESARLRKKLRDTEEELEVSKKRIYVFEDNLANFQNAMSDIRTTIEAYIAEHAPEQYQRLFDNHTKGLRDEELYGQISLIQLVNMMSRLHGIAAQHYGVHRWREDRLEPVLVDEIHQHNSLI